MSVFPPRIASIATRALNLGLYCFLVVIDPPSVNDSAENLNLLRGLKIGVHYEIRIADHSLTLMGLSFNFDVDSENKQRIFHRILSENRIQEQNGPLFIATEPDQLYPAILQFAQTIARVSSMQYDRREVIRSLFYKRLEEFIEDRLAEYNPRSRTLPIADRDEYEVDFQ